MSEVEGTEGVKARTILWYLTFSGFAINFMLRININIAIVDMISHEFKGQPVAMSECIQLNNSSFDSTFNLSNVEKTFVSLERQFLDAFKVCSNGL